MKFKANLLTVATVAVYCAGFAQPAHAYLDPSTGSMIISAIVGVLATIGLALKTYWYKLKSFFRGDRATEAQPAAPEPADQNSPGKP